MRWRLGVLMFLQYAVPGALLPLYSVRLQKLGFGKMELACCCASQCVASALTALLTGQLADRYLAAEYCLALASALAGVTLWVLAGLTTPTAVFLATLAFWLLAAPAVLLGTAICFSHLPHPERSFGPVRLWGTVGWTAPSWLLLLCRQAGWLSSGDSAAASAEAEADLFRLGAGFAFVLSAYALTLPHTPPRRRPGSGAAPLAALRLLRGWPFAVYCACALGVCITLPLSYQATPLLLKELGWPDPWLGPALTVAQATEVVCLALLPLFLLRLGLRSTMVLGLGAWTAALGIQALGGPAGLVVASLGLNGLCISGFIVAGQVFVNGQASGDVRASAQALLTFVNALGMLAGHLLVGRLRLVGGGLPQVFAVGAALMAGLFVLFLLGFREREASVGPVVLPAGEGGHE